MNDSTLVCWLGVSKCSCGHKGGCEVYSILAVHESNSVSLCSSNIQRSGIAERGEGKVHRYREEKESEAIC